ncbi:MAG TPA: hypothetical protein VFC87_04880 [Perlabentimonas sp.]|nr:hypothetical protein [Bacteroidales bacterium]MDD4673029.1 hypothetical protein [Bacteroidales bacterium]MDY0348079.1 hypothetical protein [Tenuifilaceae bacterium]HZJ74116.1 hypothetical protein [Perlabentimonas sp.]
MNYSISIEHELKIIRYTHAGLIKPEDIDKAWVQLLAMKEFTELKYNLLSDYRNGKFQIPLEFLPELMGFMKNIESIVKGKKQALIIDDPLDVAISMIFENKVKKEIGFVIKIFTTNASALQWLAI